ncbi:heterogeneous nuclear ribonucleoprotein K homolog isoform X1 [Drosophila nasuta]|uniref:Heterogeneous nuclear ribonucleoprotein K homolog isoform X1 n=3 Tax=nasuta subgroup TaxID=32307 RepID=A0A6P8XGU4_DROAB|nr:heterogeneous nuclear ribonucleoprotein K homolog isoform X1 [Drosophila albomicans]XP_060660571.1 heterogeneous nuclear ribonucleoprotein K homolog isoform X1 [Drosophila nasuta]
MKMKRESNDGDGPQDQKRNRRNEETVRILIPSSIAGAVIGKGGQHIQKMRTQYKATVSVDDSQGPERTIQISADIESTLEIITEMLKYFEDRDEEFDVRLLIHQSLAGCVIGKGGQKIKEIRDRIGCRFLKVFSNVAPQSTDRVVQTVGKQNQVIDAVREVITLTRDTPIKGPIHNYDPMNFDRVYADEYGGYGTGTGSTRPSQRGNNRNNGGGGGGGGGGGAGNGGGFGGGGGGGGNGGRGNDRFGGRGGGGGGAGGGGTAGIGGMGGPRDNPFINPWANGGGGDGDGFGVGNNGGGFGGNNFGGGGPFGGGNFSNNGFGNGPNDFGGGNQLGGGGGTSNLPSLGNFGQSQGSNSGGTGFGAGNNSLGNGLGAGFGAGNNSLGNGLGTVNNGGVGGLGANNGAGGFNAGGNNAGPNNSTNSSANIPQGHDPNNSTQVTIPKDLAGAIIGKGGGRIRRIRNESSAYITIDEPLPGSNDRIITISGTPKQIQMAQYLLQQSVHENGRRNNI